MPRFLVTLNESDPDAWLAATPEQQQVVFDRHRAFDAAVAERGALLAGAALSSVEETRTLRHDPGGWTVTEGPYAETAEQLTGVYLVELPDADVALELCRLLPEGYVVGVRPVVELEDY